MTSPKPAASSVLLALADRCEKEAPGRELDVDIHMAVFKTNLWASALGDEDANNPFPRLTSSLDAAVTLLIEGQPWYVGRTIATNMARAHYTTYGSCNVGDKNIKPATPALALCAAALRARAAMAEDAGGPT